MPEQMCLRVVSADDYEALKKNLRKYAGIRYRKTEFILEDHLGIYGLQETVEALNRKKRYDRIIYIYDTACRLIDEYNRKNAIKCPFTDGKCPDCRHNSHINGCCYHCGLQTAEGCPTCNLSCKLYFCSYMKERYRVLQLEDLDILRLLSWSQRNILKENVFVGRGFALLMLNVGSYLVFCLFSVYKICTMRNLLRRRKIPI